MGESHCTSVDTSAKASTSGQTLGVTFDELLSTSPVDDAVTLARLLRDEPDYAELLSSWTSEARG